VSFPDSSFESLPTLTNLEQILTSDVFFCVWRAHLQHPQTGRLVWMLVCRFPVLMVDNFKLMRPLEGLAKCCIENCAIFLPLLLAPVSFISGFLSLLVLHHLSAFVARQSPSRRVWGRC
jgi:hypothetical protein